MSVISTCCSLLFATTGNKAAELRQKKRELEQFFSGGFTLTFLTALLAFLACMVATELLSNTGSIVDLDGEVFRNLAILYSFSVPLLIINVFLQLFLEATGSANVCANSKVTIVAAVTAMLGSVYLHVDSIVFMYCAMSYFVLTELLTSVAFIRLIRHQRHLSFRLGKRFILYFGRFGIPIAIGMSGQKVYFYLLSERLLGINAHLVAELSVCMTLIGILMIPSLALSQIHSLQISQNPALSRDYFKTSLGWLVALIIASAALLAPSAEYLFTLFGGSLIHYNPTLFQSLIAFLTCSSLLSLAVAHLRARNETLGPQLLISFLMLGLLTPGLYLFPFIHPGIEIFLSLQSVAALVGFLMLCFRIFFIHRRDPSAKADVA